VFKAEFKPRCIEPTGQEIVAMIWRQNRNFIMCIMERFVALLRD
jgi:hypothetical protein